MKQIAQTILDTVGNTPLVKINKLNPTAAEVVAKMEYFNPGGSAKDRVGVAMIEDAEKRGLLKKGALIVEPTSGNTGIGLAVAAAIKGYKLVLTMPDNMSIERRKLLAAYGAELVLTPAAGAMNAAIAEAEKIVAANPGAFMPQQFTNPANPNAHYETTGPEIWRDCEGEIAAFVATVGTGGTLTGTARYLKEKNPAIHIVAVEPSESAVLSGKPAGPHKIQGIGAGFIPKTLDVKLIDEVIAVTADEAGETAREAAKQDGLLIGISSGAALSAALKLARKAEFAGKRIVVLLPDCGERYLSSWLFAENQA